jgi:dihydrofolate synthase/folylpolyglutamate synthase
VLDLSPDLISLQLKNKINGEVYDVKSDLPGIYQKENIATVAAAVDLLNQKGWNLTRNAMLIGLATTKKNTALYGRWDMLQKNPMLVLDVAHNEDGFSILLNHLSQFKFDQIHFILGFSKDKDFGKILDMLPLNAIFYFTSANSPRALEHKNLKEIAATKGLLGESFINVDEAISNALKNAHENDIIIVSGSIYVVGDVNRERFC